MLTIDPREARPHHNHGLFSDHYLNGALPNSEGWSSLHCARDRVVTVRVNPRT